MRLTCPNCSARYEVDESMIPAAGRDVQCSNCSSTWFQPGPRPEPTPKVHPEPSPPDPAADPASEPRSAPEAPRQPAQEPDVEPHPTPVPSPEPEPETARTLSEIEVEDAAPRDPDMPPRPPRRQIDTAVTDILRQEAERETQLRRAEPAPDAVEQQSEMSLESASETARMRRLAELDDAQDAFDTAGIDTAVSGGAAASRRELLPDIEEINSTLRATGDRSEEEEDATDVDTVGAGARRRSQSRSGFFLVLVLAAIAVAVYLYAEEIKNAVPATSSYIDSYVGAVNNARFWLDDMAQSLSGEGQ